jgi:hypothetical protein
MANRRLTSGKIKAAFLKDSEVTQTARDCSGTCGVEEVHIWGNLLTVSRQRGRVCGAVWKSKIWGYGTSDENEAIIYGVACLRAD